MSMFVITDSLPQGRHAAEPPYAGAKPTGQPWYSIAKVLLEFTLALTLLILTAPLIAVAMILVRLSSRGPALYTQTRLGRNGLPFTIYKPRTMTDNCESLTGAQWSLPGDSRVTWVGRWLRKTHVDELPQLWNVLRGEMSLIGPRPERPEFLPQLEHAIPHYRKRLTLRPGVTGLAQVQLEPDTDLESVRIKLAYDLHYVQHVSFLLDVRIYAATFCKLIGLGFQSIRILCLFPRRAAVERDYQALPAALRTSVVPAPRREMGTAAQQRVGMANQRTE